MICTRRIQRRYDHRLQDLVRTTGNIEIATKVGVPRSTARGWLSPTPTELVTLDVFDLNVVDLQQEVLKLRQRTEWLVALLRVLVVLMKVSGFSLERTRLPDGDNKNLLLRAIDRSRSVLPLQVILRILQLSLTRYHAWRREEQCDLDDASTCPRSLPQQLTRFEVDMIEEMVTSEAYRHVPTGTLAMLAQRLGKVFASASTWYRLVRLYKWRRPRRRIYPAKPKVGIRASKPNEIWHVDTTVIRLLDGTRTYLHAIIDNFSRRILAW